MPDDDATLELPATKPSRAKRAKPIPGDDGFKPDYRGPQPHFPSYGESWQMGDDEPVKFWHGTGWYLEAPGVKPEERAADLSAKAIANLAAIDGPAEIVDEDPLGIGPVDKPDEHSDSVADVGDAVSPAIARMETVASEFEFDAVHFLVADARDFLLGQIKMRPKPWSATPEGEQIDVAAACEHAATELVRKITEALATEDKQPIRALLESFVEKDGIKLTLKVKTFSEEEALAAVVGLHKARGKHVMITVASVDDYRGDRAAQTDSDQPGLGFEAGSDDHPDDDSDLAGEDFEADEDVSGQDD